MRALAMSSAVRRYPDDYVKEIPVSKDLESLIAEVNENGWLVENLFQWGEQRTWRASVRHGFMMLSEFCDGTTPEQALTGALMNMRQGRNARGPNHPVEQIEQVLLKHRARRLEDAIDDLLRTLKAYQKLIATDDSL